MELKWPLLYGVPLAALFLMIGLFIIQSEYEPFDRGSLGELAIIGFMTFLVMFFGVGLAIIIGIHIISRTPKSSGIYGNCDKCGTHLERVLKDGVPILMCLKCGAVPPLDFVMREELSTPWKYDPDHLRSYDVECDRCGRTVALSPPSPPDYSHDFDYLD